MNSDALSENALLELLSKVSDDTVSPAELSQLDALVQTSPRVRQRYLEYMNLQPGMVEFFLADSTQPDSPQQRAASAAWGCASASLVRSSPTSTCCTSPRWWRSSRWAVGRTLWSLSAGRRFTGMT